MNAEQITTLKIGDTFEAAVNLNHIRSRIMTWTVRKENKSSWTVSASDEHGSAQSVRYRNHRTHPDLVTALEKE